MVFVAGEDLVPEPTDEMEEARQHQQRGGGGAQASNQGGGGGGSGRGGSVGDGARGRQALRGQ